MAWHFITPPPNTPDQPVTYFIADPVNHPNNNTGDMLLREEAELSDSCCCEVAATCCCSQFNTEEGAPATLTLTIDAPGCPEIDGASATLTKSGGGDCITYSNGSHAIGDCGSPVAVGWSLQCDEAPLTACENFSLTLTRSTLNCVINGGASHNIGASSGCTCSPLDLVFTGFIIDDSGIGPGSCDCCPGGFSVNITE